MLLLFFKLTFREGMTEGLIQHYGGGHKYLLGTAEAASSMSSSPPILQALQ